VNKGDAKKQSKAPTRSGSPKKGLGEAAKILSKVINGPKDALGKGKDKGKSGDSSSAKKP